MGRSSSSCLRIIACVGEPAVVEDDGGGATSPETKAPSDKRRWSFRKKSGRERELSSSMISEPISVGYNKESPEASADKSHLPNILSVSEKDAIVEPPLPSTSDNLELVDPLSTDKSVSATEHKVKASDAVIIQARTELPERQNVVELQSASHKLLVKRRIVGVFRCVQAIIKIQALVRERQTCQYDIESALEDDEQLQMNMDRSSPLGNGVSAIDGDPRIDEEPEISTYQAPAEAPLAVDSVVSSNPAPSVVLQTAGELMSEGSSASEYQPSVLVSGDGIIPKVEGESSDTLPGPISHEYNVTVEPIGSSFSEKPKSAVNNTDHSIKSVSGEPLENEGNRLALGSRKTCNPAFAAVQSKFEELSSPNSTGRAIDSAHPDAITESKATTRTHQLENSPAQDPRIQIAASECGTEISISSTLDSPDRSEVEGEEIVLEIGTLRKGNCANPAGVDDSSDPVNLNVEAKNSSVELVILESERFVNEEENQTNLILATDASQVKQEPEEPSTPTMQAPMENSKEPQLNRSSPERTPNSHVTVPESQGTPSSQVSSQVSVDTKKRKKDGNMLIRKQRPELAVKKSPSTPNNDSGGSTGHVSKDSKNAKRRNSFGMAKPDHVDHEPKVGGSSTVPSYMQATKSARAKAHASISPKLSPDVNDRDNYLKKRHSLPIANVKQGSSPRMQRSPSQVQQVPIVNGDHSPITSTERRWQR